MRLNFGANWLRTAASLARKLTGRREVIIWSVLAMNLNQKALEKPVERSSPPTCDSKLLMKLSENTALSLSASLSYTVG
ncbi:hypothetical protein M407DRAFT_35117 [Tulasnella calospora MUT 4182]|uniref:Uncharacterized protein n=1 Tax=Tulasnella calospora MUT 4182 TaxID=1051891 RepID=A0A0C3K1R2_9AGAM|nr:hypothetical protein M407DRAFT_35117 [Tulasnella calospora MUT 4182]